MRLLNEDYQRGLNYYNGDNGLPEDLDRAIQFFTYAIDNGCFEAAHRRGLCYEDKGELKKAFADMVLAHNHHVEEATEWLFYAAIEAKDFLKMAEYGGVLDSAFVREVLKDIEKKKGGILGEEYAESVPGDFDSLKEAITLTEYYRRKTRHDNPFFAEMGRARGHLIDRVCNLAVKYVNDADYRDMVLAFLSEDKYAGYNSVKETIETCNFRIGQEMIESVSSYEDMQSINERIRSMGLRREHEDNLIIYSSFQGARLLLCKKDLSDREIWLLQLYTENTYENGPANIEEIEKLIKARIYELVAQEDFEEALRIAKSLCKAWVVDDVLRRQQKALMQKLDFEAIADEGKRFRAIIQAYEGNPCDAFFAKLFQLGQKIGQYQEIAHYYADAKKRSLDIEFVRTGENRELFIEKILPNLPIQYFSKDVSAIKRELQSRGITRLVHLSPIINEPSIRNLGLLSRNALESQGLSFSCTDSVRRDDLPNWISISVTSPNARMFYRKYMDGFSSVRNGLVVCYIDPKILYEIPQRILYSQINAGASGAKEELRAGYEGFKSLFTTRGNSLNGWRAETVSGNLPADSQAEVLVLGGVPKEYILKMELISKSEVKEWLGKRCL